jgi:hypothetical protein
MNLFRSEEHAKNWLQYDPVSAESIMPLSNCALAFSGPLYRNRLKSRPLLLRKGIRTRTVVIVTKVGQDGSLLDPGVGFAL